MIKVITYGTYDKLHIGHIRLLERAKALGDYLVVGVTADDFDKTRGKINVSQSLEERIAAVRATGIADEIIVESYEGQKIDDIRKLGIDIFTVGSDWEGYFDYLNEYCKVIYLKRTEGVSSSDIRAEEAAISIGLVGSKNTLRKFVDESHCVNGVAIKYACTYEEKLNDASIEEKEYSEQTYSEMMDKVDAVYISSAPAMHYSQVKEAIEKGKHVICESPFATTVKECDELIKLAEDNKCILMESIKTAYLNAYSRLLLLVKSGKIGEVVSVDTICTSINDISNIDVSELDKRWNSICAWGPTAMLPVFQLLGTEYKHKRITSKFVDDSKTYDLFTKVAFEYDNAVASIKVGKGVKSEGELIISGTKGYVYVPAPWWKTDYFEIRYEDPNENKRYFYQLDGEGIRYEIVEFVRAILNSSKPDFYIERNVSRMFASIAEDFYSGKDLYEI